MKLLTPKDVAIRVGATEQAVTKWIRTKKISADMVGGQWVLQDADVQRFIDNPASPYNPQDRKRASKKKYKHVALSFFSGAMGLDIGLEKAGIHTVLASEIEPAARRTIAMNRPDIGLIGDLWKYTSKQILEMAGLKKGEEVDLIVGGPPCQAFSTAGKRASFNDPRGNVFLRYIDVIGEIRPKFAVIENVRGLLSASLQHVPHSKRGGSTEDVVGGRPGSALDLIIKRLRKAGYGVSFNLYNSANYGAPQSRERVVILCSRDGEVLPFLRPTHHEDGEFGLPRWRTFRQAVEGLDDKHDYVPFPDKRLKYYKLLKPGQYWKDLPENLQKEALGRSYFSGGGKTGFLRRLHWDRPSFTLVTHPAMPATDLGHPVEDRPLSVQEYKRIQEFPDDWVVCGSLLEQYKQIGNAVPVSLGFAIGKAVLSHLAGKKLREIVNFPYSRYKRTSHFDWGFSSGHNEQLQMSL